MQSRVPTKSPAKLRGSAKKVQEKGRVADTEKRLIAVLRRVVGPKVNLTRTKLGLESMKMLEVVIAVENEFEITFPEDAPLGKVTASLRNLKQCVKKLIGDAG